MNRTVVCVGTPNDARTAALYFDRVVHLWIGPDVGPASLWPEPLRSDGAVSKELDIVIHQAVLAGSEAQGEVGRRFNVQQATLTGPGTIPILFPRPDGLTNDYLIRNYVGNVGGIADRIQDCLSRVSILNPPLFTSKDGPMVGRPDEALDPAVVISGLDLVNVEHVDWDQIMEFREDEESVRRFRRLLLFMHDELAGKPRTYIEDRVLVQLEDYRAACRKHGFDTVTGVLSTITDHRSTLAAAAASLIAVLAGAPAGTLVGIPLAITLAGVSIKIMNDVYSLKGVRQCHTMSYIVYAQERLGAADR